MAIDTRDWHKDQHNSRTGYTERATFRLSHKEIQQRRHRAAWRRNFFGLLATVLALVALWFLRQIGT